MYARKNKAAGNTHQVALMESYALRRKKQIQKELQAEKKRLKEEADAVSAAADMGITIGDGDSDYEEDDEECSDLDFSDVDAIDDTGSVDDASYYEPSELGTDDGSVAPLSTSRRGNAFGNTDQKAFSAKSRNLMKGKKQQQEQQKGKGGGGRSHKNNNNNKRSQSRGSSVESNGSSVASSGIGSRRRRTQNFSRALY